MSAITGPQEVYESTTNAIVAAIEEGAGTWSMPSLAEGLAFPCNPTTGKRYRGGNVVGLWMSAIRNEWTCGGWATYKQWASIGAQVRKGEKGTGALLFMPTVDKHTVEDTRTGDTVTVVANRRGFARRFVVFNAAQVDGYVPKVAQRDTFDQIEGAERFFSAVGARVEHRNEGRAYYRPGDDLIVLPPFATFEDAGSYYGTSAHEHAHWTGHKSRLDRVYGQRFGDDAYAMEELTAELSAAFTCAVLGISPTPRPDHAAYLSGWLKVLKSDARVLHGIASKAQAATDHLVNAAGFKVETVAEDELEEVAA